jgi:hypothetical protein
VAPGTLALLVLATAGVAMSLLLSRKLRSQSGSERSDLSPTDWLEDELATTDGGKTSVRHWLATGRANLVVFVDPLCAPCRSLLSALIHQPLPDSLTLVVVSRGPMVENVAMAEELRLPSVAVQSHGGLAQRLGVTATPAALVLSGVGQLIAGPALGRSAILSLLDSLRLSGVSETPREALAQVS